ncbi:MAG: SPASM domain-containing protein, partial [Candidatus Bathyarchaeia archaeon]
HARELGLNVCLLTNGWFVDGEVYRNLVKNEVFTSVSIDGPEEVNDIIRGKGTYRAALTAIKRLSDAGILNGLSMAITALNYREGADHIISLAEEYGARFVWFNHLLPCGRARNEKSLDPTPEQYEWFLNHLYDLIHKEYKRKFDFHVHCPFFARIYKERNPERFQEWFDNEFTGKCIYFLFGGYLSVLENGDVIPCFYSEGLKIGNIREKTLKEMWKDVQNNEFYKRLKNPDNLKGKCGVCEYRFICGGCRTRAYAYTGDYFESDYACAYIPKNKLHTCTEATNIAYLRRGKN